MAQQQQKQTRSQGGGRTKNSEPRVQVFTQFGGCNFELSPREMVWTDPENDWKEQEQSDLQMNFLVVQNNAKIASNKTIETRQNLQTLVTSMGGLTGVALYTNGYLFYAEEGHKLWRIDPFNPSTKVAIGYNDKQKSDRVFEWSALARVDDKLVALSDDHTIWTMPIDGTTLSNYPKIDRPPALSTSNLVYRGNLRYSTTYNATSYPYRVGISRAFVTDVGPTETSDELVIYTNKPVNEWNSTQYLSIEVANSWTTQDTWKYVDLYYTVDNAGSPLFMGRCTVSQASNGKYGYRFDWLGYLTDVSSWPAANLLPPTDNYTEGPKVSQMTVIDSRVYMWGGEEPDRLFIGGNIGNELSVSSTTGGGFVDIDPGQGMEIRWVGKYKTQSGNSIVTMLCDNEHSHLEQRYNLVENTVSLSNEQTMKSWQAEQVAGSVGCKSPHGAIVCEDGLYSVSRYGLALTTLTMEYNSQIQTNYVSDPIKPVFTDLPGKLLDDAVLLHADGVLYMSMGKDELGQHDPVIFCYDINQKAWWTYSFDLTNEDMDNIEVVQNMVLIDHEDHQEGLGIITDERILFLPTTQESPSDTNAECLVTLETGELGMTQPLQSGQRLTQIELRFDRFIGHLRVEVVAIDKFGRKITTTKNIDHDQIQYDLHEYIRVNLDVESYKITMYGYANFRLTHFMSKLYQRSKKVGLAWGFDDRQSYRKENDIHPYFHDYNDIMDSIVP